MKTLTLVYLLICLNYVFALKCVTTSADLKSTSNEDCNNSKYCFTFHEKFDTDALHIDETYHGCGSIITANDTRNSDIKNCDDYGKVGTQNYDQDGNHADLYCCDTDLCNYSNSASSNSFIGIIFAFAFIIKIIKF